MSDTEYSSENESNESSPPSPICSPPFYNNRRRTEEGDRLPSKTTRTYSATKKGGSGLPYLITETLALDIYKRGGLEAVNLLRLCESRQDLYGEKQSSRRRQVQNKVHWWKTRNTENYHQLVARSSLSETSSPAASSPSGGSPQQQFLLSSSATADNKNSTIANIPTLQLPLQPSPFTDKDLLLHQGKQKKNSPSRSISEMSFLTRSDRLAIGKWLVFGGADKVFAVCIRRKKKLKNLTMPFVGLLLVVVSIFSFFLVVLLSERADVIEVDTQNPWNNREVTILRHQDEEFINQDPTKQSYMYDAYEISMDADIRDCSAVPSRYEARLIDAHNVLVKIPRLSHVKRYEYETRMVRAKDKNLHSRSLELGYSVARNSLTEERHSRHLLLKFPESEKLTNEVFSPGAGQCGLIQRHFLAYNTRAKFGRVDMGIMTTEVIWKISILENPKRLIVAEQSQEDNIKAIEDALLGMNIGP